MVLILLSFVRKYSKIRRQGSFTASMAYTTALITESNLAKP